MLKSSQCTPWRRMGSGGQALHILNNDAR